MYLWPGQTYFGFGVAEMVGNRAKERLPKADGRTVERPSSAVFLITDSGVRQAGLIEPISRAIEKAGLGVVVYDQIPGNPDIEAVGTAGVAYRESGAGLIVAVGGGSALDAAKGVRLLAGGPAEATVWEYAYLYGKNARPHPLPHHLPPMIGIPTTAGTGAEVTPWGVITHSERQQKFGIGGPFLIPSVALVDPELTMGLPPFLTAATGMDALSHLIEAYVSTNHNPILDPMILYGIELIGRSLRVAVVQPGNRAARHDMMQAALIGGIAISSKWLGACHSLAHQLSTYAGIHHGLACALMLPPQMAYSLVGAIERYAQVALALDPSLAGKDSLRQTAEQGVEAVQQLMVDIDLPTRLRDVGVTEEMIPAMAHSAYSGDLNWWTNPRSISEAALAELYRQVF